MSKCNRNSLIRVEAIPHRRRGAEPCRVMDAIAFATAGPQNRATTAGFDRTDSPEAPGNDAPPRISNGGPCDATAQDGSRLAR